MYKVYSGKRLFWHYHLELSLVYKTVSQSSFHLFTRDIKGSYQSSLENNFHRHNYQFSKYLGQKLKFQKIEIQFCRWKSKDYNDINIFLSLENPCTLLAKENTWKCIFITNSELWRNCNRKTDFATQNNSKLAI